MDKDKYFVLFKVHSYKLTVKHTISMNRNTIKLEINKSKVKTSHGLIKTYPGTGRRNLE